MRPALLALCLILAALCAVPCHAGVFSKTVVVNRRGVVRSKTVVNNNAAVLVAPQRQTLILQQPAVQQLIVPQPTQQFLLIR